MIVQAYIMHGLWGRNFIKTFVLSIFLRSGFIDLSEGICFIRTYLFNIIRKYLFLIVLSVKLKRNIIKLTTAFPCSRVAIVMIRLKF